MFMFISLFGRKLYQNSRGLSQNARTFIRRSIERRSIELLTRQMVCAIMALRRAAHLKR